MTSIAGRRDEGQTKSDVVVLIYQRGRVLRAGLGLFWWMLCFGAAPDLRSEPGASREYQVKAVFLYNFAQFVEWPTNAFPQADSPLTICVLGDDPFGSFLDDTVRGERIKNRSVVVERYRRWEDIKSCQILFISRSEIARLEAILDGIKGRHILTVGDFEGFAQRGGMIRFMTDTGKIRLRIHLEGAKKEQLTLSSKLLRPAQIVGPGKD